MMTGVSGCFAHMRSSSARSVGLIRQLVAWLARAASRNILS